MLKIQDGYHKADGGNSLCQATFAWLLESFDSQGARRQIMETYNCNSHSQCCENCIECTATPI